MAGLSYIDWPDERFLSSIFLGKSCWRGDSSAEITKETNDTTGATVLDDAVMSCVSFLSQYVMIFCEPFKKYG